jgi:hypothetical protein
VLENYLARSLLMLSLSDIFETVGKGANEIPIPAWVFEEFGQKPEARNFRCASMGYDDGWQGHGHGCQPPDMSKPETKILL